MRLPSFLASTTALLPCSSPCSCSAAVAAVAHRWMAVCSAAAARPPPPRPSPTASRSWATPSRVQGINRSEELRGASLFLLPHCQAAPLNRICRTSALVLLVGSPIGRAPRGAGDEALYGALPKRALDVTIATRYLSTHRPAPAGAANLVWVGGAANLVVH
ncbi:hypothetical protein PVAP13_2NG098430 [Panicum virgatum]|uniref:Uncharacterized protein n=1 Tax=Panicum virgatum TaxID=38727 RepID=A0A8T0VB65_PANVG|nr:hypothetical protein PVAP13_2NG098430 [Panicum virgatum]